MISVVLMTHDSSHVIERTLRAAFQVSDDVHVIDSFSDDTTPELCRTLGCKVVQRDFNGYADQRNWAVENLPLKYGWQLHLDADEELEPGLIALINELDLVKVPYDGFILGRKIVFMGRVLRHGGINKTWHFRLFRTGFGRCEDRLYDNHFICTSTRVGTLCGYVLDHQDNSISEWTTRHNYWSNVEVREIIESVPATVGKYRVSENRRGNLIEQKRYLKSKYYGLPLFWRVFAYFSYRFFFKLGFLDGKEGLIYHVLQGFWFRFLVDAKIYEAQSALGRN